MTTAQARFAEVATVRDAGSREPAVPPRPATMPVRVCQVLYRWSRCGLELQLAAQAAAFDPARVSCWIASALPPEEHVPRLDSGMPVRWPGETGVSRFAGWLADLLGRTHTQVVHVRGLWLLPDALRAARRAGDLPVVFSFHGFDDASRGAPWWRRRIWRSALGRCAACVAVSRAARRDLARTLGWPEDRVHVIHNGVDGRHFSPVTERKAARQALGIDGPAPLLLCVGSLMPVKGGDILIEALAEARIAPGGARVCFVGTDHLGGALQQLAADRVGHLDVRFVGNCQDVRPWYAAADAVIVPSRSEGFSNVVLEAMACERPVIATRVGGNTEQVLPGRTGWLVEPGSPRSLARAIRDLLSDPLEARRRGSAGRARVLKLFPIERAARRYQALYEQVAADRPGIARAAAATTAPTAGSAPAPAWPLGEPGLLWHAYARVAWWHLLGALKTASGDHVLLPDLICDVMVQPAERLGLEVRFYRSDPLRPVTAGDLAPHVDSRTRAVLVIHYFGFPQPVAEAATFCRARGIPLIEDVSQGFLSADPDGPLGRTGDAALFSFRKTLALPHGAGLLVADDRLRAALLARVPRLPAPRRDLWRFVGKQIDRTLLGGQAERLLDGARTFLRATSPSGPDRVGPPDPFEPCLVRPSEAARWLVRHRDLAAETRRRRWAYARLLERWASEALPGRPLTTLPPGCVPYAFPVHPEPGQEAAEAAAGLVALGLPAEPWPRPPHQVADAIRDRRWVLVRL